MHSAVRCVLQCLVFLLGSVGALAQPCGELFPPDPGTSGSHDFPFASPVDPVLVNGQACILVGGASDTAIQRFDGTAWQPVPGLPVDTRITALTADAGQLVAVSTDGMTRNGDTITVTYRVFRNTAVGWIVDAVGSTSRTLTNLLPLGTSVVVVDPVRFGDWHVVVRINYLYCGIAGCNLPRHADTLVRVAGTNATSLVETLGRITDIATDGRAVYIGGEFTSTTVPGQPTAFSAPYLVRWTGASTASSNGNLNGPVTRLMAFTANPVVDFTTMIVSGSFTMAGTLAVNRIAQHDTVNGGNGAWSTLGSGLSQPAVALLSVSAGLSRNNVVAAYAAPSVPDHTFVRFNSGAWSSYAPVLKGTLNGLGIVSGQVLAVGSFPVSDDVLLNGVARLNTGRWMPVETTGTTAFPKVLWLDGQDLFVGGAFNSLLNTPSGGIARRSPDGVWHSLAGGVGGTVNALTRYGAHIIAAGAFSTAGGGAAANIAGWDGAQWQPLAAGLNGEVRAVAVWNNQLIAIGAFTASGATSLPFVASWNGTAWSALGALPDADSAICIAVFNGQPHVGGMSGDVRRWDGVNWTPIGSHPSGPVLTMTPLLGSLYLGGSFILPSTGVARWTGSTLLPVNGLLPGSEVRALAGDADELFVAGALGAGTSSHVVAWNGSTWRGVIAQNPPPSGFYGPPNAIIPIDGGGWAAGELYSTLLPEQGRFVARWSDLPVIANQPEPVSLCGELPASTAFSIALNGEQTVTLRWSKNGVPLNDTLTITGATEPTLTLFNLGAASEGDYSCTVTDQCGNAVISDSAALTIGGPACCAADFNADGTLSVQDLFDFLSAYFASDPAADFNDVGGITVQDIFDFLNAWFAGCS